MERLRESLHRRFEVILAPVVDGLGRLGVTPNQVTAAGLALNLGAAVLIIVQEPLAAGLVYLSAGILDLMDGSLARRSGRITRYGAFLDSSLDRISEGVVFAAIAYHFAAAGDATTAGVVVLALLSSFMVSYTRARAEGLGLDCGVGWLTRAERIVLVAAGLISGWLLWAIYLIALVAGYTAIQRIAYTRRAL